jgi:hypothetical protein
MDSLRAINHKLFSVMTEDTTLINLLGNTNIREGFSARFDDFPYIIFFIDPSINMESVVVANCGLQIDIWDKPTDGLTSTIYEIRSRLIALFDNKIFKLDGGEVKAIRTYLDNPGFVFYDPDEEFVLHMVMGFTLKYFRSADLNY